MPGPLISADSAPPVGAAEFADLLHPLGPLPAKIAIAVSGGPDSMALAFCLNQWGQREVIALIVDHALRDESMAEAEQTKARLEKIGIKAEILRWDHDAVTTGLHEKARAARYDLLLAACRRHNATALFTAHHAGDQAETILMRLAKGSGIEGLAGMRPVTMRNNIHILRPFLTLAKTRLVATCEAHKIDFIRDPSNASEKFARGRLREIMPLLEREGMTQENLLRLGARAGESDDALDHYARIFLNESASIERGGSIRLDKTALHAVPRAIALRGVSMILRAINNDPHPPAYDGLSNLLAFLLAATGDAGRSFYNCLASMGGSKITFLRESAATTDILPLPPGNEILWDGRWLVRASPDAPACDIRALGSASHEEIDRLAPDLRRIVPQGRVRATMPALWQGKELVAIPSFDEKTHFQMRLKKQSFT